METTLQWGLNLIIAIQQYHTPALDTILRAITFLGEEQFYILLLPFVLWCVDFNWGVRLSLILILSSYINTDLKDLFRQPRPFDINSAVKLDDADGYGLPSGHAQLALAVWGALAVWIKKLWFWIFTVSVILLISFSRIYLGVHFPTDIFAGWTIGIIFLCLYFTLEPGAEKKLTNLNRSAQLLIAFIVPVILILLHPVKDTTSAMGILAGAGAGLVFLNQKIQTKELWWKITIRLFIGIIVLVILYAGLKILFPKEDSSFYLLFRFLRYSILGIWATFGAPKLFQSLNLMKK